MVRTPTEREYEPKRRVPARAIVTSLLLGLLIGAGVGGAIGWFAHRLYYQHRIGQNVLCRQQHANRPPSQVDAVCGPLY